MEYTKPEVTYIGEAAQAIQSMKPNGAVDILDPTSPEFSVAAFDLDE
jgi:hypothetical protein